MNKKTFNTLLKKATSGITNPTPIEIATVIQQGMLVDNNPPEDFGIMVEDELGECRNICHVWYDQQRGMVRLSIGETKFEDYLNG